VWVSVALATSGKFKCHVLIFTELSERVLYEISNISRKIAEEEIQLYDADKTGKPDFALENSGKFDT
jgi:hypothetical protein